jgi:sugar phosphate isomerase/epimerase
VEALMPDQSAETTVYRLVERLADWGVNELHAQATRGDIDFAAIFEQLAEKAG